MLFGSTELAGRIEAAATGFLRASIASVARARPDAGAAALELGGGVAAWAGDGSPLNKVAGLGFAGPVDPATLARVEAFCAERACPVQVELSALAEPSIGVLLTERGYRLIGFENVLGRPLSSEGPGAAGRSEASGPPSVRGGIAAGLTIELSDAANYNEWMDTVVAGFGSPDQDGIPAHEQFGREALERVMADMAGVEGMLRYLARVDGQPAGGGSMYLADGIAQLSGAATLPRFRRRGVQATLLARRLEDAGRSGADLAVVTTQPGSTSQRKMQRNGFQLLYARVVLAFHAHR